MKRLDIKTKILITVFPKEMYGEQLGEYVFSYQGLKG